MGGGALCVLGGASHRGGAGGGVDGGTERQRERGAGSPALHLPLARINGSRKPGLPGPATPSWNLHVRFFWVVEWG